MPVDNYLLTCISKEVTMPIQELQEKLIVKIKNIKQDYILEEVSRLLEFEENLSHIYNLNPEQQQLIDRTLKEIESGEYFTVEEVQKDSEDWLKK